MKKILFLIGVLCCAVGITANGEVGDVTGHIYSTNIRAYINGVEVPSYNIGGRTVAVIEDITSNVNYNENLRVLKIDGNNFEPVYGLISGKSESAQVSGDIIGDIYETDIKVYMYDTVVPSYNIGGKTAVALEDLGGFKEYNDFGGRYFYDDNTREIKLELLYGNGSFDMKLVPANIKLSLSDDKSHCTAEFYGDPYLPGGNIDYDYTANENMLLPIMTTINGAEKQLGYFFSHKTNWIEHKGILMDGKLLTSGYAVSDEDDYEDVYELVDSDISFAYLFDDVAEEGKNTVHIPELSLRDQTVRKFIWNNMLSEQERFETDDYLFIYGYFPSPHGSSDCLMLIQNDGSYRNYREGFKSVSMWGTIAFENVRIDKENEKCYFHYDKDYVIDFKTGELKEV